MVVVCHSFQWFPVLLFFIFIVFVSVHSCYSDSTSCCVFSTVVVYSELCVADLESLRCAIIACCVFYLHIAISLQDHITCPVCKFVRVQKNAKRKK